LFEHDPFRKPVPAFLDHALDRYRGGNENFALVIVTSCGFEVEPDGLHEGIEVIDDSLVAAIEL
jgi:hypothetical protein